MVLKASFFTMLENNAFGMTSKASFKLTSGQKSFEKTFFLVHTLALLGF
jgi:hypothetical protein